MDAHEREPVDPYRAPGVEPHEAPPPPVVSQPPTVAKAIVIGLLLAIGLPVAAVVLLFAVCTALFAFG